MNCNQVEHLLHDYIEGDLSEALQKAVTKHRKSCSTCNDAYEKSVHINLLLKEMPVPPPSEGFVDRVLKKATQDADKPKPGIYTMVAGAVAAGFAVWFVVASVLFSSPVTTQNNMYSVTVNSEVKTVKVAINSETAFDDVQMSVELSPNLEIAGYGNRTSINWGTRLKKGVNVINLPVVGLAIGEGQITTRIKMNGKEKVMHIQTNYQTPNSVWHHTNTATSA